MLLDAAWAPLLLLPQRRRRVFATAGRDKLIRLWVSDAEDVEFSCQATIPAAEPVTAVDFLPWVLTAAAAEDQDGGGVFLLAVGTEAGQLVVHELDVGSLAVVRTTTMLSVYVVFVCVSLYG
jgi:elongator complex protein 2